VERQPILSAARAENGSSERGFALIEMLCVLAIIGMLAAIILPAVPRATSRAKLESYAVETAALLKAGRAVLFIDAFQTGSAVASRDRDAKMFLTFNKSDDANRVQDILTALAWLKQPNVQLVGLGKAAIWCQFAAAVAPVPVKLQADLSGFTGSDDELLKNFFVPGIQRAGGLQAARRLVQ